MENPAIDTNETVLVPGATVFAGSRLIPEPRAKGVRGRMLVRREASA